MTIKIDNYDSIYRVVTLLKDYNRISSVNPDNEILYINNNKATLLKENKTFDLSEKSYQLFCSCNDHDVFEISNTGVAFLYYSCSSLDNGILVTNKCNSNCIMCPTPETIRQNSCFNENHSADSLINIIKYFPSDANHITITGGEPFIVKKDLFIVLKYLKDNYNNVEYLLLTNGRAFSIDGYAELFYCSSPENMTVAIPIHGHISKLHDYITQAPGSFEQTVKGIKLLSVHNVNIELRIVVSKLNADYLFEISNFIINNFHRIKVVNFIGLEMTGNAAKNADKVWIDYSEAYIKSEKAIDNLICSGFDVGIYNFPLCFVKEKHWMICSKSISEHKIRYSNLCTNCSVIDACGGLFSGTIRYEKDKVKPVVN